MTVRVLGVDPGLASTGWGVIEGTGGRIRCIAYGVIRTTPDHSPGSRLRTIYEGINSLIETYHPDQAGIETLYFTRNTSSALPVAQSRGVVLLALNQQNIVVSEFTPQIIKQSVVGTGNADKEQVMQMVRVVLGMSETPRPDHAADALAAAVAMLHNGGGHGV